MKWDVEDRMNSRFLMISSPRQLFPFVLFSIHPEPPPRSSGKPPNFYTFVDFSLATCFHLKWGPMEILGAPWELLGAPWVALETSKAPESPICKH